MTLAAILRELTGWGMSTSRLGIRRVRHGLSTSMDGVPRFADAHEARERRIIVGQAAAHMLALALGVGFMALGASCSAMVAAWLLAFMGDPLGARVGAWMSRPPRRSALCVLGAARAPCRSATLEPWRYDP